MKLALVIVSYSSYSDICVLLESIKQQKIQPECIIVVDNCSPNGDGEKILKLSRTRDFLFIAAPHNNGFAAGCNIGIKHAQNLGMSHVGLINPDTIMVYEDVLSQIVEAFSLNTYGIIGTYILSARDRRIEFGGADIIPGIFYPKVRRNREVYTEKKDTLEIISTDYTTGSSLFFSILLFEKIGRLDESYFLYFEETDWCLRARKYGYSIGIISSTALIHKTSQSIGFRSRIYTKYMIQNYARFAFRYFRWYEFPLWLMLYILFWVPGQIMSYLYRKII